MNMPKFLITHWDSKLIKYEHQHQKDDRLAVVASFPSGEGNIPAPQFLAAPLIPDSTGASMTRALIDVLQDWEIPQGRLIRMSWDTTASNTGRHIGSSTLFEQELEVPFHFV